MVLALLLTACIVVDGDNQGITQHSQATGDGCSASWACDEVECWCEAGPALDQACTHESGDADDCLAVCEVCG